MKRTILICSALLMMANVYAGRFTPVPDKGERTTMADVAEDNYDIKHLRFNLNVTDTSVFVSGDVSTTAQVVVPSMTSYVFELDTLMHIDSAKVNGVIMSVTTTGEFLRKITLSPALPLNSFFTAQIFYHGVPPPGGGFFNGITHAVSAHGTHMVYTVSDPWVALNWWPAKQSVLDKIDSVDMYVNVPAGVVDGSNGLLVNVDMTSTPGYWKYHWQTHYPINYYLISIAVAKFAEYKSYMHFTGSTDSMLIQNFFIDTATFNPLYKANFDSVSQIIDYYSTLFGRYPFWKEKYGVCYTNLPGGMEHQTMTTIGVPNTYIIAHELMHQWFGDNVSYASWHDVWLSEAFATFAEQLFLTQFWGAAAGKTHRQSLLSNVLGVPCGMTYVTDTTTSDSLFFQPTVYNKGQAIVTMLRYMAPTDSQFFHVLRNFQSTYAYGNATTANFQAIAEAEYGFSLDTFFNQWIYGRGYPKYRTSWYQAGTTVYVKLIQTQSCPSYTNHFSTPLELQFHAVGADTFIKVYNSLDTQYYSFEWSPTMTNMYLNPDALTICTTLGAVIKDPSLGTTIAATSNVKIYPNPSGNSWHIEQLPGDTGLTLTDMNGRVMWRGKSHKGSAVVPGDNLPAGDYLLKMNGNNADSIKLTHW